MHTACCETTSAPAQALPDCRAEGHVGASMQGPDSLLLSAVLALAGALRRDEVDVQAQECLKELLPTLDSLW